MATLHIFVPTFTTPLHPAARPTWRYPHPSSLSGRLLIELAAVAVAAVAAVAALPVAAQTVPIYPLVSTTSAPPPPSNHAYPFGLSHLPFFLSILLTICFCISLAGHTAKKNTQIA